MPIKKPLWIVAAVIAAALLFTTIVPRNPLWKSQQELRASILKEVPLGSSVDQVKALIAKRNWKLLAEWHGKPSNVSSDQASFGDYPGVNGEYFIQGDLGSYQGLPWRVGVDAHWGFDPAGRLVDLRIRKIADAL